jgi:putative ABC transport system permease protein
VTAEISLTVVVLFCTGLLGESLLKLTNVNLGFDPDGAVATRVSLPSTRYLSGPNFSQFFSQINDQIADLPGVTAVGESQSVPLMNDSMYGVIIDGRAPANRGEEPVANYYSVTPGYFAAMGIKLKQGRLFSQSDRAGSKPVTIVDESFVSRYFPNSDALGKRIRPSDSAGDWREIVGVVGSVRQYGPEGDIRPQMYEPFDQRPFRNATVIIRSSKDPNSLIKPLRVIFRTADPSLPVGLVSPLRGLVRQILSSRSFSTSLLAIFSLCALLLAGVGLYSTLAYLVTQMTHQFGIRMAIGASAIDILRLVVAHGLRLAIAGTIVGVVVALSAGRLIAALVVGTSTSDSLTLVTICAVMLVVSLIASIIPGWRAALIKPMEALRYE